MKKFLNLILCLFVCLFTVNAVSAQSYTLTLDDTFGDGWRPTAFAEDATLDIQINGASVQVVPGIDEGFATIDFDIPVADGDVITLTYATSGAFDAEHSFTLADDLGNEVFSSGTLAAGDDGTVFGPFAVSLPVPCTITCPDDIIATLGSGECTTQISYLVETAGDCETVMETTAGFVNDFDLGSAATITFGDPSTDIIDISGAPDQLVLTSGTNGAFSTSIVQFTVTQDGTFSFDWSTVNLDAFTGFDLFGIQIQDAADPLTTFNILAGFAAAENGTFTANVTAGQVVLLVINTQDGIDAPLVATINNVSLTIDTGEDVIAAAPIENGDQVAPGDYTVTAQAFDLVTGAPVACNFDVTVNAFVGPFQDFLQCGGGNNITLNDDCTATLGAEDVLIGGPYSCFDDYTVALTDADGNVIQPASNVITGPGTIYYMVSGANGENPCWNSLFVEDKTAPTITCTDVTVGCNDLTTVAAIGQPVVDETCGGITLTSTDATINGDCADGFLTRIFRTFTATNASGMSATCVQTITVNRQSLADVTAPSDFDGFDQPTFSCDANILLDANGNPSPEVTGFPQVNGEDASEACGLLVEYEDENSTPCEGTTKIFRTWTITDWCVPSGGTGANRTEIVQFIKIEDKTGPVVDCPGEINVSTDFDACVANVLIPVPALSDNCASTGSLSYTAVLTTTEGTLVALPSGGYVAQNLPIGKATILYTGVDPCGNQSTCSTDIFVTDQVGPAMSCETFREVTLQNINPNEPTLIFAEAFDDQSFDACGIVTFEVRRISMNGIPASCIDFDWTTNGPGIDSDANGFVNFRDRGTSSWFPAVPFSCCDIGTTVSVELRATDEAGNSNICMIEVNVEDKANPIVACPADEVIECGDSVPGYDFLSDVETAAFNTPVFAGTPFNPGDFLGYYDGVVDNCGATLYISEGGSLNECSVGTLTRRFQAQDANGNLSTPCTQRISVINSDPFEIVDTECRTFPRTFGDTTLDPVGPRSENDDVEWPCDLELTCGVDPTPDNLEMTAGVNPLDARPQIQRNDECDIIAMIHEDMELPIINNEECRKILRTWTITDHCQFEINNSTGVPTAGFWQYTQLIKITDNEAPVLNCSPVAGSESADAVTCNAEVELVIGSDSNNCEGETLRYTWAIDAFNDGSIDFTGDGNDATNTYPTGEHRIIWSVEDYCGNVGDDCVQLFYVVDNTPPNIVAVTEFDVNLANGLGEVWPSEVESSSFDLCSGIAQSLLVNPSLGDDQMSPPAGAMNGDGASFTCTDLPAGASDVSIPVDYWVQDGAGNWAYVTILINVDDSQGLCPGNEPQTATVAGTIMTEELEAVGNVTVNVDGNSSTMPTAIVTGDDGAYSYALETEMNYSIEPTRIGDAEDLVTTGLTAYDLILLGQHLLEQAILDSPYKLIAADIDRNGYISSLDMIALRRVLLFIDTEFANNTSWRFVETAYNFPNPVNPFATTFPEVINYNNLTADQLNGDFVAVKIGDLNTSAQTTLLGEAGDTRSKDGELMFNVEDQKLVAGNTYSVDVKANDFNNMLGYQFTLDFDQNVVEFEDFTAGALRGLTADNFGFAKLNEGALTTVWTNTNGVSVANNEVLFTLNFIAKKDGNLSDVISVDQVRFTPAEAYTNEGDLFDVAINFGQVSEAGISLSQNRPNPFRNETVIEFELPEATTATLTIYDVTGRVLEVIKRDYSKGANMETINASDLNATGVLYYQLDTPTQSATMKMIVIK